MRVAHHPPGLLQPLNQVRSPLRTRMDTSVDTTNVKDIPMHLWYLIGLFAIACNGIVFALSKPKDEAMRDFIGLRHGVMRMAMVL